MTDRRSGGCLCGRIRYTAPAQPLAVSVCHCRDCQRQAGSAFSVLAIFPRDELAVEGDLACHEAPSSSGAAVRRHFCGGCGSPIYSDSDDMAGRGIVAVKAGTLDDVADLAPVLHVWTVSRQPWVPLPAGAERLDRQ